MCASALFASENCLIICFLFVCLLGQNENKNKEQMNEYYEMYSFVIFAATNDHHPNNIGNHKSGENRKSPFIKTTFPFL